MLRPLVRTPIGFVGGVAVLLLQLAYEAILLAPDFLKLVVGEFAPLFARMAFELFPLALDDVPVHLRPPPEGQPCPCASSPSRGPSLDGVRGGASVFIERLQPAAVAAERAFRVRALEPALAGRSAAPAGL